MFKRIIQVSVVMAASVSVAFGEDSPITNLTAEEAENVTAVERVEVTGSHIKRLSIEGASPVQTVTRKDLEKSGYNSVSDVLRDTGASSFGGVREASGSNAAGVANVNLRGLGSSNTLVLLNGQRLPTDAVNGAVDLNMIPMAAVERIEVLKDGASAIYGSDALGGVVNIITRKDFKGTEARISQTVAEGKGGARTDLSLVNGVTSEKLNVVTVAQFRDNAAVYARDRSWSAKTLSTIGGPGSYQSRDPGALWNADSSCPPDRLLVTPTGTKCTFNPSDYMTKLPMLQQMSLMSEGNYQVSPKVRLTTRVGGTQRKVKWTYASAPDNFVIPADVADKLGPGGTPLPGATPGKDLLASYRLTDLGTRDTEVDSIGYNVSTGSKIAVSDDWEMSMNVGHNAIRSKDRGMNGYALISSVNDAIASGAFNPFAPEGQKGSLEATRYVPEERTTTMISSAEMKISGPLVEIAEEPVALAVGSTVTHQKFTDVFDEKSVEGDVYGNAGSSGGGQRRTQALFSELSIPLFDSRAEIQLAGRFDHYSDFGSTANPKAALLIRPVPQLLLRGSVGKGFKAPLMKDLYAATSDGNPTFIDHVACDAARAGNGDIRQCNPLQHNVVSSGNTGLKEERSLSYNFGAVFEPSKSFNIGADAFMTKVNNVVDIDYEDLTLAEKQGIDLANHGVVVTRDSHGEIETIHAPLQNLSAQRISGIDISAAYRLSDIRFSNEHSRMFEYREEGFPGTGLRNKLDEKGKPRWKNTVAISYVPNDFHDATLSALSTAGQQMEVKEAGRIATYTTLDLSYSYRTRTAGTFSLGVKNVLGTTPPLDLSNPSDPLNDDLYDQIGRQFIVGYSKTF
jgi:iron complex outermembrane recepter protein